MSVRIHQNSTNQTLHQHNGTEMCIGETNISERFLTSLFSIAPDEMVFQIMKTPGYIVHIAVMAEEVIHLIKCIPIDCRVRQDTECHNELPVTYQMKIT